MKKPIPISKHRLRSIDEKRLIERPLLVRSRVIQVAWRRKPGMLAWLATLAAFAALLALAAYLIMTPIHS